MFLVVSRLCIHVFLSDVTLTLDEMRVGTCFFGMPVDFHIILFGDEFDLNATGMKNRSIVIKSFLFQALLLI